MQTQKIGISSAIKQNPQVTFGSNQSKLAEYMERIKTEYISSGIAESLKRNNHMNQYKGEPVDIRKAEGIVDKLVAQFVKDLQPREGSLKVGDIGNWCIDYGKNFHKNPLSKDTSLAETTRDAVVVDFLNYVCAKRWLDLAMYTTDLQKVSR